MTKTSTNIILYHRLIKGKTQILMEISRRCLTRPAAVLQCVAVCCSALQCVAVLLVLWQGSRNTNPYVICHGGRVTVRLFMQPKIENGFEPQFVKNSYRRPGYLPATPTSGGGGGRGI